MNVNASSLEYGRIYSFDGQIYLIVGKNEDGVVAQVKHRQVRVIPHNKMLIDVTDSLQSTIDKFIHQLDSIEAVEVIRRTITEWWTDLENIKL